LLFHKVWTILSTRIQQNREWYYAKAVREDSQISNTTEVSIVTYPHQDLWFGLEPWVLSSSILFGISHVGNWMPLNRKYFRDELAIFLRVVSRKDEHKYPMRLHKDRQILSSVYQSQHALVMSLICFVPVYQHRGLMASIGSHAAHNLICCCIPNSRYMLAIGSALCKLLIFTSLN
jgi:membrane protease YdiL (CAAX protease family)